MVYSFFIFMLQRAHWRVALGVVFSFGVLCVGSPVVHATVEDIDSTPFIVQDTFKVGPDAHSGAFNTSYPITLPPGRNGLQPSVSLNYTSSDSNEANIVGYGWSLSIPKIERINKHGSDMLYSNHDFTSTVSGELEDVSLSDTTHGTYGAKVDDGSFLTYTYNTDETWTVTDKAGTTYTYGGDTSAQVVDPSDSSDVFTWYLTKVEDTNGNTVTYTYTTDGAQVYPENINYTGNGSTSGLFDVAFTLESKSDVNISYAQGFEVTTSYRVSQIDVKEDGSVVRSYALDYSSGDNDKRSLLTSITESGTDASSTTITKPATTYSYSTSSRTWTTASSFTSPVKISNTGSGSVGVYVFDVNGDGLQDIVQSRYYYTPAVYINNGDNTFMEDSGYTVPLPFSGPVGQDMGVRVADVDGDGYQDLVYARELSSGVVSQGVYINNKDGTGWTEDTSMTVPVAFVYGSVDLDARIADVNGDGLPDIVQAYNNLGDTTLTSAVYINNGDGTGWTEDTSYATLPAAFGLHSRSDSGLRFADVNGDGLADLIQSRAHWDTGAWVYSSNAVYINTGTTSGWVLDSSYTLPEPFVDTDIGGKDAGMRMMDVNGDGLTDLIMSRLGAVAGGLFINNGDGTGWTQDTSFAGAPVAFATGGGYDYGVREGDNEGHMLEDVIFSRTSSADELYTADGTRADLMTGITSSTGSTTTVTYGSSAPDNSGLFFPLQVVSSIETDDGLGNTATTTYKFENGSYYYNDEHDRKFAGFGKVTTTDPLGNVTVDYYHQGNGTDTSGGESTDDISKIWKRYREDQYDDSSNLYKTTVDSWTNYDLGSDRDFVYDSQHVELLYDGMSDHVDRAVTYTYDMSSGNLTQEKDWGQVTASTDGTYTDMGGDIMTKDYTYATWSSTSDPSSYKASETLKDQPGNIAQKTSYLYDGLSSGSVSTGNVSEKQQWINPSSNANTDYSYDSYGLVATVTDPRGKVTTYTPDSSELYPATVTDAVSHTKEYTYDYSSGKVIDATDNNGFVTETTYDGFDRPTEVDQPNTSSPTTLEAKVSYVYDDTDFPSSVHETDHIDSSTSKEIYTYFDGFGRPIQRREESPSAYNVTDTEYDARGDVSETSLPYSDSGSSRTSATTTTSLLETTTYDALHRPTSKVNAAGTTSMSYVHNVVTTTDPDGNKTQTGYDMYGRIHNVVEDPDSSAYATTYGWDPAGRLTVFTDASGNVRHFNYNGLGNRTSAQDLHGSSDTNFGTWNYTYDADGNMSTSTNPDNITITYTYDDVNRVLTADTPATGTDETYAYDSCTDGVGKLCSATLLHGATTTYTYDALGRVAVEGETIGPNSYSTTYGYTRQGAIANVTYPDTSTASYIVDAAGNVNEVDFTDTHGGGSVASVSSIAYGPSGKVSSVTYANGVTSSWDYDSADLYRLVGKTTTSSGSNIEDFTYGYDADGNLTSLDDASTLYTSMSIAYGYDVFNRLTSADSTSTDTSLAYSKTWSYNALGDLTASDAGSYTYGGTASGNYANPHAPTAVGSATLAYNHDGDLVNDGTWGNVWNYKNELVTSSKTGTSVIYNYDYQGNRVLQGTPTDVYNYPNQYYSTDNAKKLRNIVVPGIGTVATSTWDGTTATTIYHHDDHLGGTHVETDSTGAAVEYELYLPYGGTLVDHKSGTYENKFKFTGKEKDTDTGWYYYVARYYNPTNGVFQSEDPVFVMLGTDDKKKTTEFLSDPQNTNSYSYARDNPIRYNDPTGKCIEDLCIGEAAVAVAVGTEIAEDAPAISAETQLLAHDIGMLATSAVRFLANAVDPAPSVVSSAEQGAFSIFDWKGYPEGIPKPSGPFNLLEGDAYKDARAAADSANRALHAADPSLKGLDIHEVQPVKFGGNPTDVANKIAIPREMHSPVSNWWSGVQRQLKK